MTTQVEKSIVVNVPISTAYNQWTQFEDFPQFMGGVTSVTQLGDNRLHWVAEIAGVKREWEAQVLEQVPDQKVAWAATSGASNAGAVFFESAGPDSTNVRLSLEYEPEGLVEKVGDKLNIVEKQAQSDLDKFKIFIEDAGYATGAWRGSVNADAGVGTPGVEHAQSSQGDSGKAGLSAKAVVTGVAAAAAGIAAAGALKSRSDGEDSSDSADRAPVETTSVAATPVQATTLPSTPVVTTPTVIVDDTLPAAQDIDLADTDLRDDVESRTDAGPNPDFGTGHVIR